MKTPEVIDDITHEEILPALQYCFSHSICNGCPIDKKCNSGILRVAIAYIEQLEEENMCMKILMHGDCGVCKHRSEQEAVFRKAAKKGEFAFTQRCEDCIKNGKSAWEYEGLPELPKKGASK